MYKKLNFLQKLYRTSWGVTMGNPLTPSSSGISVKTSNINVNLQFNTPTFIPFTLLAGIMNHLTSINCKYLTENSINYTRLVAHRLDEYNQLSPFIRKNNNLDNYLCNSTSFLKFIDNNKKGYRALRDMLFDDNFNMLVCCGFEVNVILQKDADNYPFLDSIHIIRPVIYVNPVILSLDNAVYKAIYEQIIVASYIGLKGPDAIDSIKNITFYVSQHTLTTVKSDSTLSDIDIRLEDITSTIINHNTELGIKDL